MTKVKSIPEGYHTVTPHLSLKNAAKALEFYKEAFGAQILEKCDTPDGKIMHAVIQIGNSRLMIADEFPQCGITSPQSLKGSSALFHIYVEDVDAFFNKAIKAGGKVVMPIADAFWGDRYGQLSDPFGHYWSVATHKVDLTKEEINKAAEQLFAKPAKSKTGCCCC
jgi:PhnB protein